jgi:hypothetical protein
MNKNFKPNERELIKIASFFKKQSKKLIAEGKLGEENKAVAEAVDRFIEHMNKHADTRAFILEQRDYLKKLVKDNAQCPQCRSSSMLKVAGTEKDEKGWKSNRYKCRKCNIYFTWNMPNNPWDMIQYIQEVLQTLRTKKESDSIPEEEKKKDEAHGSLPRRHTVHWCVSYSAVVTLIHLQWRFAMKEPCVLRPTSSAHNARPHFFPAAVRQ